MEVGQNLLIITVLAFCVLLENCSQSSEFTCMDGTVITADKFCNGNEDCDGSDETLFNLSTLDSTSHDIGCFQAATNRRCLLHRDYICNGTIKCVNITFCDVGCPSHYKCRDNSCVPRSTICDGDGCNGCSEDEDWTSGIGFKCVRNGATCLIPQQLLWDNVQDCDDGSDLCYEINQIISDGRDLRSTFSGASFNHEKCFACLDGSMAVPRSKVCDGIIDCSDLSDECLCSNRIPSVCDMVQPRMRSTSNSNMLHSWCKVGEILCSNSNECVNRSKVCDGTINCPWHEDERYEYCQVTLPCRAGLTEEKGTNCRCDGFCKRRYGVLCDGVGDCPPPVDGAFWREPPGFPSDECWIVCNSTNQLQCTTNSSLAYGPTFYRFWCQRSDTLLDGSRTTEQIRLSNKDECNGILQCTADYRDESNCPSRFTCPNGTRVNIPIENVCDGVIDCDNKWDENTTTCAERDRFYCSSMNGRKISVPRDVVCDFNINCDNGEDERNCSTDGRFYCENGKPLFVKRNKVFDGRGDCTDWSDECPTTGGFKQENVLASRYELIGNPFLRALVWIMGIIAVIGNVIVIVGECKQLHAIFRKPEVAPLHTNHMLVLNLAISDFLMGVYLIILGIVGGIYSGVYCTQSLEWLTSKTCSAMGVLVVLSSETSMITMLLLTLGRLYATYRPFTALNKPSKGVVFLSICLTWIISFIIAFLPLTSGTQNVFVETAWIQSNPFFGDVVHFYDVKEYAERMLTYSQKLSQLSDMEVEQVANYKSWWEIENFFGIYADGSDSVVIHRYFGYYTANSVCIPNLFVTREDWSWKFSLSVTMLNFIGFLFVAIAYASIIWKVKHGAGGRNHRNVKTSEDLQRKILRLLITDFCCWIPLCIMVFINFSGVEVGSVAYAVAAIVLLPINSALNPILYSNFIDTVWLKMRLTKSVEPILSMSMTTRYTGTQSPLKH